ncbi:MAG TPA: DUF58 domain-containing protein [Rhodocyclaceae bacterium]|nr:DUF58 domain-containing protein [Rhodocyclaceae bacterium]
MINPFRHGSTLRAASAPVAPRENPPVVDVDDGVVRVSLSSLLALHHAAESLPLKPGRIRSQSSGAYQSAFKGRGMEFDEVRPYMPGDDARTLDWRVTARTGKPHTKLFREERERAVLLWVDLRSPMFFATRGAFKAVRAAQAAAMLAWSATHQGDRLGALIFNEDEHIELRPRRGKLALLGTLKQLAAPQMWQTRLSQTHKTRTPETSGTDALNSALSRLRRVAQPGSLIVLLSDFSGLDEQGSAHLAQLARHNDMILADIHDPLEAELPPPGRYRVSDGNNNLAMDTAARDLRTRYQQRFAARQAELQQLCRRHHMNLLRLSTADSPLAGLQRGLGVRA